MHAQLTRSSMKIKDFLKRKKIKQLRISKETGISPSKLSMFINSWAILNDSEIEAISKYLKISPKELTTNNIKEK